MLPPLSPLAASLLGALFDRRQARTELDPVAAKLAQRHAHSYEEVRRVLAGVAGAVEFADEILKADAAVPGARHDWVYFERRRLAHGGDLRPGQSAARMEPMLRQQWEEARYSARCQPLSIAAQLDGAASLHQCVQRNPVVDGRPRVTRHSLKRDAFKRDVWVCRHCGKIEPFDEFNECRSREPEDLGEQMLAEKQYRTSSCVGGSR